MQQTKSPAAAQASKTAKKPAIVQTGKWEFDVHGGSIFSSQPTGGTGTLPAAGQPFFTFNGSPSRQISSWYFGDGNKLFTDVNNAFGATLTKIPSLDPALTTSTATRGSGFSFGARVGRTLTPRLAAEVTFDFNLASMNISRNGLNIISASVNGFKQAWIDEFSGFVTNFSDSSTSTIVDKQGKQMLIAGDVVWMFNSKSNVHPYLVGGMGFSRETGEDRVSIAGHYQFFSGGGANPKSESDTVAIRYTTANAIVGIVGAGVKMPFSARSGLRLDGRALIGRTPANKTLVSATPVVDPGSPQSALAFATTAVGVQFSTLPGFPSSLSGPALADFQTFAAGGMRIQLEMTAAYFIRF